MAKRANEDDNSSVYEIEPGGGGGGGGGGGDWDNIKEWLLTKMKDNIVEKDFSFDKPMNEWPSFDDVVYTTFLKYLESSWTGKYMIQIEALKSHYKSFYCNLMRVPMRKAVLQFINANKIPPGMFGDLFIKNIFPEYMRNNVYIGNYLTHTKNITTTHQDKSLFVIRNNDSHENGKNRRRVFVYHRDKKTGKLRLDDTPGRPLKITGGDDKPEKNADDDAIAEYAERTIPEVHGDFEVDKYFPIEHFNASFHGDDDDDDDDDIEIVSIEGGGVNRLFVLDINGGVHIIRVFSNERELSVDRPSEKDKYFNDNIVVRYFYKRESIETYWDIKTSKFLPLNQLKIIAIYKSHYKTYNNLFFLTDAGDLYAYFWIENQGNYAFIQILLPSEAQKIVLFSSSYNYLVVIDSNNTLFVAFKMPDNSRQESSIFHRIHTFDDAIILISFQRVGYYNAIVLVDKSNFLIIIGLEYEFDNDTIRDWWFSYAGVAIVDTNHIQPVVHPVFYPHILSLSWDSMLIMDNEIMKPVLFRVLSERYHSMTRESFALRSYLGVLRHIINGSNSKSSMLEKLTSKNVEGSNGFIMSLYNSSHNEFLLLDNQRLIRLDHDEAEIISTPKKTGKWKFECSYCGNGTNMVHPVRLLAFCSEECCTMK